MPQTPVTLTWHKALDPEELPEGRVKTVTIGTESLCMTHHEGSYGALDNRCPHQGGPLGEGSIENGLLRCPWHGWDYCPLSGKPPGGYDDGVTTHPVEVRDDGVYVGLDSPPDHVRTVSDVMIDTMVNWGVRWCFGMVGHSNLNVADALRRTEEAGTVRFIGIRHEGAASFACSAYGKLTGRPASCLAIAGPGATNLLTGLWDANVDRAPVVALTGQVASQVLGTGNFQEVDLKAAFGKVAAWSAVILPDSRHAELMTLACKHAILARGVAHLIFPDEVAGFAAAEEAGDPEGRVGLQEIGPPAQALENASQLLQNAKRPVFIVGHGARNDMLAIIQLAETLNAPVLTTFKGKGLIGDDHPLGCGVLGRSGTPIASWFMNESDLLVVFGASFSNHTGITPKKPTIQIDVDPLALGKFHKVDAPVWGSLSVTVAALLRSIANSKKAEDQRDEIARRWNIWRSEKARRILDDRGLGVNSASIFAAMTQKVPDDAIIAVDVGNNTYSFGRYFECKRQSLLMSGYLGSIGFGFPAAMGAWAATQERETEFAGRKVVSISGDGGFGQYMGEFNTAVKYGMDITHVLLNNSNLGKITKEQRAGQWEVWQTSLSNPSFAEYAKLCGGVGIRVEQANELEGALEEALACHDRPSLIEVVADQELI
jgi:pyruvate oxidase